MLQSLNDVFVMQLDDLLSAERQLVDALPNMANAASDDDLRKAFQEHAAETRDHVSRLEDVFGQLGISPPTEISKPMQAIIAECEKIVAAQGDPAAKDAALIACAQLIEHYEIAAYGTARTLAGELGQGAAKDLLDQTLDEESQADKLLTKIAMGGMLRSGINQKATA